MRGGWFRFVLGVVIGVLGACSKSPAPGEDVASSAGPPIVICYEPDGAPCPLPPDAGDEGGEDGGEDGGAADASGASG
jgi:hypothetical protein